MNFARWSGPTLVIASSLYSGNSKKYFPQCNDKASEPTATIPVNLVSPPLENDEKTENKTEYELWLEEKQKCGLCRMFIASPCREQVSPLVSPDLVPSSLTHPSLMI
jgi:hypothetical protein